MSRSSGLLSFTVLAGSVLLSGAGWWLGTVPGAIGSVIVVGALALIRQSARRSRPAGTLASMPMWQLALIPMLGLLIGFALGAGAFILGPGF